MIEGETHHTVSYRILFLLLRPRQGYQPSLDVPCNQVCISDKWCHEERNSITLPNVILGAYRLNHGVIKQAKGKNNSPWNRILTLNKVTPSLRTWMSEPDTSIWNVMFDNRYSYKKAESGSRDIRKQRGSFQDNRFTTINRGNTTYAVPIIRLAKIIQDLSIKKAKFSCMMQKDEESFKVVWGVVYDLNLSCLKYVSKVDQDSMINLCNSVSVKEDLSTVPVKLGDISKIENPDPMTETFYLHNKSGFSHTRAQDFNYQFNLPEGIELSKHFVVQGLSVDVFHQETIQHSPIRQCEPGFSDI